MLLFIIEWALNRASLVAPDICLQCRRCGLDPWVGKIPWRRKWQPTPVPGEAQGQQSLVGCHLWGHTQSRTRLKRLSSSSSSEYSKNHSLSLIQFSDSIPLLLNEYQIHTRHSLDLSLGPTPVLQLDAYAIGCIYASGSFPHVPKLYLRSKAEDN